MGYRVVSLGDVIKLEDSKRQPLSSRERDSRRGIYPYYGAQGIVDYLDDYTYEGDYLLVAEDGENLRSRKQPIANAAHGRFRVNNHAHVIAATKCCNLIYLRHLLNSMDIAAYVTGSTQPKLSQTSLLNMKVELPEIDKQDAIAAFLHCFDAKITANTKLNGYLAELLEVLYGEYYLRPQGYDVHWCELGSLCEPISKKHSFKDAELVFLNTGDVERGLFLHSNYSPVADMPGQAKKSIEKGDILYSEIRPINRHYAYVNFPADDYVVSTKLMVLRANNFDGRRLYQFLTLRKTVESLQQEAEGRSGTFPQIRFDILAKLQVPIAPAEVEEEYKSLIHVIYDLIDSNVEENGALSLLRDSLLPRLMSGEIDVSKVELPMQLNSHLA